MKKLTSFILLAFTLFFPTRAFSLDFFDNLKRVGELGAEIDNIKKQNEELREELDKLKKANEVNNILLELYSRDIMFVSSVLPQKVYIEPSSKEYSVVACKNGYFAVSCKDIKPYSTGSEITIKLVNMLSVGVLNAEMTVGYSTHNMFDDGKDSYKRYKEALKEKKERIADCLYPATEKLVTVRLPEYKPDQIKIIEISITAGGIRYKPN